MPDPNDAFVIQLTDPEKIAEARRIIAGQEKTNIHVLGNLVPGAVKYNQPWRFSLDPTTIRFVPASPGMCARDAVTSAIEDEIETNSPPPPFCWGPEVSTVTKEVPAP